MAHKESRRHTSGPSGDGTSLDGAPDFLTVGELREILRIGKKQAYALVRSGRIGSCRLGGSIRIPKAAIEQLLDAAPGAAGPGGAA